MYAVLHLVDEKKMTTRAGFVHVPAHPSFVATQVYPLVEMPSMSVELMTDAVPSRQRPLFEPGANVVAGLVPTEALLARPIAT